MKKRFSIIAIASCFCLGGIAAPKGSDDPAKVLPGNAVEFLKTNFANDEVSFAKKEREDLLWTRYEVILTNGNKIEFDGDGKWVELNCKYTNVPENLLPVDIKNYVNKKYKDAKVLKIEKDKNNYEVDLSNNVELTFNKKFQLIDVD